jgi:sialidase-1
MDNGETWTTPKEITNSVKKSNSTWYATGPVNGIQLKKGNKKGRLIIPCDHIEAVTKKYFSHIIFSDNGGLDWELGGSTNQHNVNECTVVELNNGKLILNMRNYNDDRLRKLSISEDQGESWKNIYSDNFLIEPICQASMISIRRPLKKEIIAFSNPNSRNSREKMSIKLSLDKTKTWPITKLLHNGPSAYSNLIQLNNKEIGCLFEGGYKSPYEGIAFKKVLIKDLLLN